MTTGNKIMWKRGEIAPHGNFSSFQHYFIYIFLTSGVKFHIHLLNVVVQFIVFLTFSTLICRSTDISKCFSESFGIRDNGSRLYFKIMQFLAPNSLYTRNFGRQISIFWTLASSFQNSLNFAPPFQNVGLTGLLCAFSLCMIPCSQSLILVCDSWYL